MIIYHHGHHLYSSSSNSSKDKEQQQQQQERRHRASSSTSTSSSRNICHFVEGKLYKVIRRSGILLYHHRRNKDKTIGSFSKKEEKKNYSYILHGQKYFYGDVFLFVGEGTVHLTNTNISNRNRVLFVSPQGDIVSIAKRSFIWSHSHQWFEQL